MIFAIVFAQVWGVIQLIVLGSLARTVRVRTIVASMALGLYAVAPVAVIIQKTWIGIAATLLGRSMADITGIASYTVDPFLEEALKLLPLVLLMLIPAIRRQWSITDCVLIAAAIGSGFGLAEHLYRYASSPHAAEAVRGGWEMSFGRYTPMVPGIFSSLTSWLPNGVWFPEDPSRVNWHLAWSAIGGLALGLFVRNPKRAARVTAGVLFLVIGLDHAAGNTHDIGNTWLAFLAAPLDLITSTLGLLTLVTIVVAWWLDRPALSAGENDEPLLAAERAASPRYVGTLKAAFSRLPWSLSWVSGFDRARRAYHAAHATAPGSVDGMLEALVAERDLVERKLTQPETPPLIPPAWKPAALRNTLRQRPMIISLVMLAPSILYLIVGGFPQTAWVQTLMIAPVVWQIVLLITVVAQARLVWRVVKGMRNLPKTARLPIGDDAAILGLQLASGIGSVALGGFTLLRVLSGVSASSTLLSHAHASDAANRLTPGGGVSLANSGGAFDPHSDSEHSSSNSDSNTDSNSDSNSDSNTDSQPQAPEPPSRASSSGSPSDYSPLPPPPPPPPSPDDLGFHPSGQDPLADSPSDYSPLPPPSPPPPSAGLPDGTPGNEDGVGTRVADSSSDSSSNPEPDTEHSDARVGSDSPDASADHPMVEPSDSYPTSDSPQESTDHPTLEHSDSHPEPDLPPGRNEHPTPEHQDTHADSPEESPDQPTIQHVGSESGSSSDSNADSSSDSNADSDEPQPPPPPKHQAPSQPQLTPQEQADRAADAAAKAAAQADADAQAAHQRLTDAHNAQDSSEIKQAATDPGADPDVAAARQRTHDAEAKAEAADNKSMLDGDDPWDPNAKSASDAAHDDVKAAQDAQADAERSYAHQQQAAADAAKAASDQAQEALNAANAKAAAAHDASAQAASSAGHAADADSAASDYAAAQAKADAAWAGNDTDAYSAAQKAALAAKERLEAARAAADAARDKPEGVATWTHKKP